MEEGENREVVKRKGRRGRYIKEVDRAGERRIEVLVKEN